ncbi:hypothetical protein MLD38_031130 [Melastoma candidum]|uniref:Uncharacterized protein n=1 Tax=Melastoma candidum TaxID=119954 RepID=A0ACB9MTN7_9MYRT|nr:hypothetical protein MLD38_031130 [Melastoma candidum]
MTQQYFHNIEVHCLLCPRNFDNGNNIIHDLHISTMFTHHRKIIVAYNEMIMSFAGGIGHCDGRYDALFHSSLRTLDIVQLTN